MKFKIIFIIAIAIFLSGCTNIENKNINTEQKNILNTNTSNVVNIDSVSDENIKKEGVLLDLSKNFLENYNILHREKFLGDNIYLNNKKILENSYNIWPYSYDGKFYTAKDSTLKNIPCGDVILEKQEDQYSGLNFWCINYKNNYYVSNSANPLYIDDNYIIYQKCEDYEYLDDLKKNGCVDIGLYLNNKKIDESISKIIKYTNIKNIARGFDRITYDNTNNKIAYIKLDGEQNEMGWYLYNIKNDNKTKLFNYEDNYADDVAIFNNKVAYTKSNIKNNNFETRTYDLYLDNNLYATNLSDKYIYYINGDLYFLKYNLEKYIDDNSALFKVNLLKNNKLLATFYSVEHKSFNSYLNFYTIKKYPNCLPKDDICLLDNNNFIIKNKEIIENLNTYKDTYLINNKKIEIKTTEYPFYLYPILEDNTVKYVIFGDGSENKNYIKNLENGNEEFLYDGDAPIIIYKK